MEGERKDIPPEQKTSASHTLQGAKAVPELVKQMYIEGLQAVLEGKPVAWVMVSLINPIIMAMDVVPIMPENWAGLCATKRMAEPYILRAERELPLRMSTLAGRLTSWPAERR